MDSMSTVPKAKNCKEANWERKGRNREDKKESQVVRRWLEWTIFSDFNLHPTTIWTSKMGKSCRSIVSLCDFIKEFLITPCNCLCPSLALSLLSRLFLPFCQKTSSKTTASIQLMKRSCTWPLAVKKRPSRSGEKVLATASLSLLLLLCLCPVSSLQHPLLAPMKRVDY